MSKYGYACAFGFGLSFAGCDPGNDDPDGTGGKGPTVLVPTGGAGPTGTGGSPSRPPTATGGSVSGPPPAAVTITGQYDWRSVARGDRNYIVQNNVWGSGASQSLSIAGVSFEITQQTGNNATNAGPVSYPSVFIGSNYDRATIGSNLPKQVSSLTTIETSWSTNAGTPAGTYNAAYDVWFSTGAGGDPQAPSGGYLMVWLHDPPNAQPIGNIVASSVSIPGVPGNWEVWVGPNAGKPCISYLAKPNITELTFDLNLFIKDAVTNRSNTIQAGWYLTNVFAGFEVWSGGVGLKTTDFTATVN